MISAFPKRNAAHSTLYNIFLRRIKLLSHSPSLCSYSFPSSHLKKVIPRIIFHLLRRHHLLHNSGTNKEEIRKNTRTSFNILTISFSVNFIFNDINHFKRYVNMYKLHNFALKIFKNFKRK